jgi:hypothetical protein
MASNLDLASLLLATVSDNTNVQNLKAKFNVQVPDSTVNLIKQILNICPEFFNTVKDNLMQIFADGKLDASDIPSVVLMCVNLYESHVLNKIIGVTSNDIIEVVKMTILLLIEHNVIKVDAQDQKTIIASIDISAQLLGKVIGNKEIAGLFSKCKCW